MAYTYLTDDVELFKRSSVTGMFDDGYSPMSIRNRHTFKMYSVANTVYGDA